MCFSKKTSAGIYIDVHFHSISLSPYKLLCYAWVNFDNTLIRHKNRVFRKRFLNRRNLKTPAAHILSVERKLPKGSFSKKMTPG